MQETRKIVIKDKFAKAIVVWITPITCLLLIVPPIISFLTVLFTSSFFRHDLFTFPEPYLLEHIRMFIYSFQKLPAEIVKGFTQILPAFLIAVSLKSDLKDSLSRQGRIILSFFILGIICSIFSISLIEPSTMGINFTEGKEGLQKIISTNETVLKLCLTYAALLLGIKWPIENTEKGGESQ